MSTEASGFDPTAVERVFATELTAEERAELGAVCMRHGITPDHPVLLAVAEQLIFRRRLDERLSRFEAIAQRVEAAADRVAANRERPPARRPRWSWLTVPALVAIVGLGAWFLGGAVAAAHVRLASARISSAIATPAGAAAMRLLEANGDALPQLLARCQRFTIQGRRAANCTLWDQGPAPAARVTPWSWLATAAAATPAWAVRGRLWGGARGPTNGRSAAALRHQKLTANDAGAAATEKRRSPKLFALRRLLDAAVRTGKGR